MAKALREGGSGQDGRYSGGKGHDRAAEWLSRMICRRANDITAQVVLAQDIPKLFAFARPTDMSRTWRIACASHTIDHPRAEPSISLCSLGEPGCKPFAIG
jgi:hypothetical protein